MKEFEITVQVLCDYENLHRELIKNNFEVKEEDIIIDKYMVNSSVNLKSLSSLDILKECVLVRDVVGIDKSLVYKYKKYDENENILEEESIKCPIVDINKAIKFMECINYRPLFEINDKYIIYANEETELAVQIVNDKHIFIEIENKSRYINKGYFDIEDMRIELEKYHLPYDRNDYFVSKAKLVLEEVLKNLDL